MTFSVALNFHIIQRKKHIITSIINKNSANTSVKNDLNKKKSFAYSYHGHTTHIILSFLCSFCFSNKTTKNKAMNGC